MPDGYFVRRGDVEQVSVIEGIQRRTLGVTDEAMVCEFHLEKGAIVPLHHHMNDQVGYVMAGEIELTVGDKTEILKVGDSYAIPGGIQHGAKARVATVLIDVFSPPREDYRTEAR